MGKIWSRIPLSVGWIFALMKLPFKQTIWRAKKWKNLLILRQVLGHSIQNWAVAYAQKSSWWRLNKLQKRRMHFVYCEQFFRFFFRHPSPLPFVVSIFRRHLHSTRPYYALQRSHFFAAISIAAMLTQLHLKNAPKFVSLFAGDAAAARENMSKISREKMERQGSAFDCLQLS